MTMKALQPNVTRMVRAAIVIALCGTCVRFADSQEAEKFVGERLRFNSACGPGCLG